METSKIIYIQEQTNGLLKGSAFSAYYRMRLWFDLVCVTFQMTVYPTQCKIKSTQCTSVTMDKSIKKQMTQQMPATTSRRSIPWSD